MAESSEPRRIQSVLTNHSVPQSLEVAARLITLAHSFGDAPFLPACAAMVAGSALAQHLSTRLDTLAKLEAMVGDDEIHPDLTVAGRVNQTESFRGRMLRLPEIISENALELDPRSDLARTLHELIDVRNRLMHIDEPAVHGEFELTMGSDGVPNIIVPMKVAENPWSGVSLTDAERYLEATKVYCQATWADDCDELMGTGFRKRLQRGRTAR